MYLRCENMYFTQKMFDEIDVGDLNHARFIGCSFRGLKIKLGEVYLSAMTFENCVMSGCEVQMNVANLSFRGCDLSGSKFEDSGVMVMYFEGANCEGASFRGCDLSSVEPLDYEYENTYFDYSAATSFFGSNLKDVDFEGANLEGVMGLEDL